MRYLTADLPGVGGRIKAQPADFVVEEIPLYQPLGEGEHTYFEVEKTGLSTFQAVRRIARALNLHHKRLGYAGLKDAQAVTRQVMSVQGVPPEKVLALELANNKVLWARRHKNKLKTGHLKGNRFTIRIRDVDANQMENARRILAVLEERGVPNYFGEQRFGRRDDTHRLGRAIVNGEVEELIRLYLGRPHPEESPLIYQARERFEAGDWAEALALFPSRMSDEREVVRALIKSGGSYPEAYSRLPRDKKRFFVSAYQSYLFNHVLDERLDTIDRLFVGDVAFIHAKGAAFLVEDVAAEQPRADRFEISPSGPLYGYKLLVAEGTQGELERRILAAEGLSLESFRLQGGPKAPGARRPLRFPLLKPELWYDEGLVLAFELPKGCYATSVLAEITKTR
jgi:tRNA pseudouridine13 synthase